LNTALYALSAIARPFGYADEKFADSFPRMYGYGEELVSALGKLENQPDSVADYAMSSNPIGRGLQAAYSVYLLPYAMISYALDPHPMNIDRAQYLVKDLKDELNDPNNHLSPATKKQMMKDAEDIQKAYDEYMDNMMTLKGINKNMGFNIYQQVLTRIFGGSLKGKVVAKNVNTDINRFFDDID
jgi:DNA-binding ferritin-like protein (Dps family)